MKPFIYKKNLLQLLWVLITLGVSFSSLDAYLDASMTRLMLVQTPLLILLGICIGPIFGIKLKLKQNWALAGLFISLGMIMFWMVPRSLDLAVSSDGLDAIMHLTLLVAGWILSISLPNLPLLFQMAVGIYVTSMGCTFGIILAQSSAQVCARFTVEQQQEAGISILWASGLFLILHSGWSLWKLVQSGSPESRQS